MEEGDGRVEENDVERPLPFQQEKGERRQLQPVQQEERLQVLQVLQEEEEEGVHPP